MNENVKDGNQQVSIQEQQATQSERKQSKETVTKSGLTLRELTIVGLLAAITIILGLSGVRTIECHYITCPSINWCLS